MRKKYTPPKGVTKQTGEFLKKLASLNLPPVVKLTPNQAREQMERGVAAREAAPLPIAETKELRIPGPAGLIPARLYATNLDLDRPVEMLLLRKIEDGVWKALVKPGRRLKVGSRFETSRENNDEVISGKVLSIEPDGERIISLQGEQYLDSVGEIPLPPYINETHSDPERYQTVYSKEKGSIAAPTAGLHFTSEMIHRMQNINVENVFVTLHVGWDTFRPIKGKLDEHKMHSEFWSIDENSAERIRLAKAEGRRVIAVGTTVVRLLENAAQISRDGCLTSGSGWVDLFIKPGYEFQIVDALITNFHLPKSTLMMLVSAFSSRENILSAYSEAVREKYRFFSFGDAMFIS